MTFLKFLHSLETEQNQSLIESITKGYLIMFESTEEDDILDLMNMYGLSWEKAKEKRESLKGALSNKNIHIEMNNFLKNIKGFEKPDLNNELKKVLLVNDGGYYMYWLGLSNSKVLSLFTLISLKGDKSHKINRMDSLTHDSIEDIEEGFKNKAVDDLEDRIDYLKDKIDFVEI